MGVSGHDPFACQATTPPLAMIVITASNRDAATANCGNYYLGNLAKCAVNLPVGLDPLQAVRRWSDAIWIVIDRTL